VNKLAVDIGSSFGSPFGVSKGPADLVSLIVTGAIGVAGVIALFLLILGGIGIISGAGSDNPQQVESGKKAITYAIGGFILVFVAYWIIRVIEIIAGVNFITTPGI
jgi:hypothetical protein